jgi:hypothetical protein
MNDDEIHSLDFSKIKVIPTAKVHSEHGKATRCDIKQRSVGRSIDQWNHHLTNIGDCNSLTV